MGGNLDNYLILYIACKKNDDYVRAIMNDTAILSNKYQYDTTIPSSSVGSSLWSRAVVRKCSVKKVVLNFFSQKSQKNTPVAAYIWCQLIEIFGKSFCKKIQTLNDFKSK